MTSTKYPTDLTDAQWDKLLPYLPEPSPIGRPLKWEMRSIINAIFYIVKSGCQWRMLPHQMPPWQTVYSHFRKWKTLGTWVMIHQALHEQIRCDIGKAPSPTVAIIDSQSVKTTELEEAVGMFTATATDEIKTDIVQQIVTYGKTEHTNHSVERENLKYSVIKVETTNQKYHALAEIIETVKGKGIIYAGTRKKVEEVSKFISTLNVKSDYYHAGRPEDEREYVQNSFFDDNGIDVIVATNAFGMGIDKDDIRFVVHWDMPSNLENYLQESGRAGRDGKQSLCVLLYKAGDEGLQEWFIEQSAPNVDNLINTYKFIYNQKAIDDYRLFSATELAEELGVSEDNVKLILSHLSKFSILRWFNNLPSKVTIETTTLEETETLSKLNQKENYDFHEVCKLLKLDPNDTYNMLSALQRDGKIKFQGKEDTTLVELTYYGEDIETSLNASVTLDDYYERKNQKTEKHLEFIHTKECRTKAVKQYFGETHTKDCGNCDNCNKHLQEIDANMLFAHLWFWAVDDEMKEKPKPIDLEGTYYEEIEENTYIDEDICPF